MKTDHLAALLLLLLASPPLAAQAPAQTTQQLFDAGTVAADAGDWAKALQIYQSLETRLAKSKSARNKAIVQLRKGSAMWRLRGDDAVVTKLLSDALAVLPESDATLASDRFDALLTLGNIAAANFDYVAAAGHLRAATAANVPAEAKSIAYNRLIAVGMFVDPARALADADTLLALLGAQLKVDPEWLGLAHGLRGRVLLNLQRPADARGALAKATKLLGGLNYGKINLLDISARSDAAIVEFRSGDDEAARRLLSLSGAAMQSGQGFSIGARMQPPPCDPARGLNPADVAVVEFAILEDGTVGAALPIYFSGKPALAIDFARAVSGWTWTAPELAQVSPAFRLQTRLELRCTTANERPSPRAMLVPDAEAWLKSHGIDAIARAGSDAAVVTTMKAELAKSEAAAPGSLPSIYPLTVLAQNPVVSFGEKSVYADRALRIAQANAAPPAVLAFYHLLSAQYTDKRFSAYEVKYQRLLTAALTEPAIAGDATARNALTVAIFDALAPGARQRDGRGLLAKIADDAAIPANDPYKVGALIRLANLEAAQGRIADARTLFEKSGLSAQQCALVDATPKQTGGSIDDEDYPMEAIRWGFSGWTVVEYDIDAAGRSQNVRPLIAFPPFVFGSPTVARVQRFRFTQSYRPEGGLGCGGRQQRVSYLRGF